MDGLPRRFCGLWQWISSGDFFRFSGRCLGFIRRRSGGGRTLGRQRLRIRDVAPHGLRWPVPNAAIERTSGGKPNYNI
ncbi:hypothetical protein SAY87_002905 [Trapa incisa]|uniref:Uncharacterized protein n=1 Tax=Trapa incisa TaxID=236973 RepID=A0AAN7QHD3_9MYRT|nr:hypothetical protein SAY87_002905 [Trapa incisa]